MLRSLVLIVTAICCSSTVCQLEAAAADAVWTGWLGPNRDGWVKEFQPPSRWPQKLSKSWQVDVGAGYGSPLVSGGRIFQHARLGEDEVVFCFDLKSGATIWRKADKVPFKMGGGGERHGKGPKSNPVLAGGRLFTMSITGTLSAWDAESGRRLWKSNYGSRFKSTHPYWGHATSPIVDGNRVIVHFGTDDEGALVALDVETGNEVWNVTGDGASYSSPLLVEIDGVRQIIEWNHNALVGVDSKSGAKLWSFPFPHVGTDQNMPTPSFFEGRVLLGGENRGIVGLDPRRDGDSWTVRKVWHQKDVALDMSTAVVNGQHLFGFSHYGRGRFFCLDMNSGNVLWQGPGRTGENVMFLSIPGHVVALINRGELRVFSASTNGYRMVASYRVADSPTWAPPVLLEDGVLIKDNQKLTRWSFSAESNGSGG